MVSIGASLMCSDMGKLREAVQTLDRGGVDYYHFDIMDGRFVPNFTMGPDLIKSVRSDTDKPFDAHLMIEEPERYIDLFADAGANMISVHAESKCHLQRTLQQIRSKGLKAGLALNPSTPLNELEYVLDVLDYVCVMTVNPGFGGQAFIPSVWGKIEKLKRMIDESGRSIAIQVDGNINSATIPQVIGKGASMLVCGSSSLFRSHERLEEAARELKQFVSSPGLA